MIQKPKIEWDALAYDRLSDPQFTWGVKLLDSIVLRGDETVLDAGCGSGRLTEELVNRLPHGKVVAFDSSPNMLAAARERLSKWANRVEFLQGDLSYFSLPEPVGGIFSNATLHWVWDHDAMFHSLFRALKPGGWLVAQFGGEGNLSRLKKRLSELKNVEPFATHLKDWLDTAHYESNDTTVARMVSVGFKEISSRMHSESVCFADGEAFAMFVRKVNAHKYVAQLPPELEERFISEVTERAAKDNPPFELDYVRLTIRARRPAARP